ncbi:MAG: glycosyltransferase [Gemmobacter sp.]|nr:glycosyltransferase [Gemmobacter sp.]
MQSHIRTDAPLPLISVIIPCHNVAATIRASLQTVRRQLYRNLEILCIENGSSDETLRLLQDVAERKSRGCALAIARPDRAAHAWPELRQRRGN